MFNFKTKYRKSADTGYWISPDEKKAMDKINPYQGVMAEERKKNRYSTPLQIKRIPGTFRTSNRIRRI